MALCQITGTVQLPDGTNAAGRILVFKRNPETVVAQSGHGIVPDEIAVKVAADGTVDFNLYTGNYIGFLRNQRQGNERVFKFPVPEAATALFQDILQSVDPVEPLPSWLTEAFEARDDALEAADRIDLGALDAAVLSTSADAETALLAKQASEQAAATAADDANAQIAPNVSAAVAAKNAAETAKALSEAAADDAREAADAAIAAGTWDYKPANAAALAAITGMTTGQTALVLDTMHVWQYNGSAWVDTGESPLAGKADTRVDNLLDPALVLDDTALNTTSGLTSAATGYWTSDFIPVAEGVSYAIPSVLSRCWYVAAIGNSFAGSVGAATEVVVAPAGARYLRIATPSLTGLPTKTSAYVVQRTTPLDRPARSGKQVVSTQIGTIDSSKLDRFSIPVDRLKSFRLGKNLFNKAKATDGYYDPASGALVASATYCYSEMMPVIPGQRYRSIGTARFMAFYGANGNKVSSSYSIGANDFTIPENAYYAVASILLTQKDTFQFELGAASTAYEAYQFKAVEQTDEGVPVTYPAQDVPVTSVRPDHYGRENLRETRQRLRALRGGLLTTVAKLVIAALGDSWTHNNGRWTLKAAQALWNKYGGSTAHMIGYGSCSFGGVGGSLPNGDVHWNNRMAVVSGTFTVSGANYGSGGGPDICQALGEDGATSRFQGNTPYDNGVEYRVLVEGGAGSIRWSWDNGVTWQTTVDLSAMPTGLQSIPLTGKPTTGQGIFLFQVVTAATLYTIVAEKPGVAGILFHKLGATGTRAQQWAAVDATRWQAGIANLAPDLVVIMHGTNDQTVGRSKAQFKADIETMILRSRAARPTCDILLIAPCENQRPSNPIAMSVYADALYELAVQYKLGFLDLQQHFGVFPEDYAAGSARPWFNADGIHPEPDFGGWAIVDAILWMLGEQGA